MNDRVRVAVHAVCFAIIGPTSIATAQRAGLLEPPPVNEAALVERLVDIPLSALSCQLPR